MRIPDAMGLAPGHVRSDIWVKDLSPQGLKIFFVKYCLFRPNRGVYDHFGGFR